MNDTRSETSILEQLMNRELDGITFIRDYIQLLFGGPIFNLYVWPTLQKDKEEFTPTSQGYRDALCHFIGRRVIEYEEVRDDRIILRFDGNGSIQISLKSNDRVIPEAALLQDQGGKKWNVW